MRWVGYWMIVVATLHLATALVLHGTVFGSMFADGILGTGNTDATKLAFWFAVASPFMLIVGLLLLEIEGPPPFSVGIVLGVAALVGIAVTPLSGFWLLLPPSIAIVFFRNQLKAAS